MKRLQHRRMKGGILATALVACTLMLLAVLTLLSLFDLENALYGGRRSRKQKKAFLEAALLLYERDSAFMERLDENGSFRVFGEDSASRVAFIGERWGLYEAVRVSTDGGKVRAARLVGYAVPARPAALYVCDNRRAFTLAGNSDVRGRVYVPKNGLLYGQVQGNFYSGKKVPETDIQVSSESLPALVAGMPDAVTRWMTAGDSVAELTPGFVERVSFFDPVRFFRADDLSGVSLEGHIVVRSDGWLRIDSTSRLKNILAVARCVRIGEGFAGSLQAMASDTVIVESRVRMKYPSGIAMPDAAPESRLEIGPGSEVNGYAVFRLRESPQTNGKVIHYLQQEKSRVRGLVWIDGTAEVHGIVTGSLWVRQADYRTPQGMYGNLLYNAAVYGSDIVAYPCWMEGIARKKTVGWLE